MATPAFSLENLLVSKKRINPDQLEKVKQEMRATGQSVRQVLYRQGVISERELIDLISAETKIPYLDLASYQIDKEVIKLLPESFARRHRVFPLFKIGDVLTVAAMEPLHVFVLDELKLKTGMQIELVLVNEDALIKMLDEHYKVKIAIDKILKAAAKAAVKEEPSTEDRVLELQRLVEVSEEASVINIVNFLLSEAISQGASDIHVEPEEKDVKVRYRIDGIMYDANFFDKRLQSGLNTRIKILSNLDIAEIRRPQDGQFQIRFEGRDIDLRVASFPTIYGENLVLRILDKEALGLSLESIGFTKDLLEKYYLQVKKSNGIVLVTGPTGSGKTTTLYATLQSINDNTKNIITIEDPVEYRLDNVRQSQVNVRAGVTFANGLRAILRQDPDVIMVGEVRDLETAEIAIQAALTGHLVFSTLHTNDAPGALIRLEDMGIEPFLIASAISTIIGQRLIRKICPYCKHQVQIDPSKLNFAGIDAQFLKGKIFYEGKGCNYCHNSGYSGRTGIFEIMIINDEVKSMITAKTPAFEIKELIKKKFGFEDLKMIGIRKAIEGVTSLTEVLRATQMN